MTTTTTADVTGVNRPTSIWAGPAGGHETRRERGRVLVVHLLGEFDAQNGTSIAELVAQAIARRPDTVLLDLAEVDFFGSAALSVLVEARHRADEAGIALGLVAARRATLLPLELTGLARLFPVFPTVHEAVAELGGPRTNALSA